MSEQRRTLVLLRHAKSGYPDDVADHDRPLAPRGEREAALAGDWLRAEAPLDPPVQAVLCSSAKRTRQTLERTGIEAPARFTERIYGASPGAVIAEINAVDTAFGFEVDTLLVIGHEPTMSALALGLSGAPGTDATAAENISAKYPTSALAVLRITGAWADVELGSAALTEFHIPR